MTQMTPEAANLAILERSICPPLLSVDRPFIAGGMSYIYDGDGKRVEKCTAGSTPGTCAANPTGTLYWTGPGWDPLLETDLSGNATEEYVFFNGERVARVDIPANTVEYYFSDHLNSTDIVTNATGGIVRESDYVPYGGEVVISGTDPNRYKFTGKERDPESGLDDFDARFYSSPFGRFMTPDWEAKPTDVPYANFGNPQSLNLYSYVQNNPTTTGDPDGHECDACGKAMNFLSAAGNAWTSDNVLGVGRQTQSTETGKMGAAVGDVAAEVTGGVELLLGGGGNVAGLTLDLTGLGSALGVPLNVVSTGVMIHGGATTATGFSHLLKSASESTSQEKPPLSDHKEAVKEVHKEVGGSLPKGEKGKFGSPQRGNSKKGYRLDPGHPNPKNPAEAGTHINWWDYTRGKRGTGGRKGAVPVKKP